MDSTKRFTPSDTVEPATKKIKTDSSTTEPTPTPTPAPTRDPQHGIAPIKAEFLVQRSATTGNPTATTSDDAAEASGTVSRVDARDSRDNNKPNKKKQKGGQNKARKFHFSQDEVKLCQSLVTVERESEFEGTVCEFAVMGAERDKEKGGRGRNEGKRGRNRRGRRGEREKEVEEESKQEDGVKQEEADVVMEDAGEGEKKAAPLRCKFEHGLRKYLEHKKEDILGVCPIWAERGVCANGWRCRWLSSHTKEENGELFLVKDEAKAQAYTEKRDRELVEKLANYKGTLGNKREEQPWEKDVLVGGFDDPYGEVVNNVPMALKIQVRKISRTEPQHNDEFPLKKTWVFQEWSNRVAADDRDDNRAAYVEPPPRPEEKRKLYFSKETPVLAPLTTTGNLPFRRLCISLGAKVTYSEMAMSTSLLQGHKPEWALLRAHTSELPTFAAQICSNKLDPAMKITEVLTSLFPSSAAGRHGLSFIDLNCGCPIDLVYQNGGGSALLDQQNKLARILKGMNYVSGETPITCKIRMGTKDNAPTAKKLVERVIRSGDVQAITLHGRSRQQRYTKAADWSYIAETSALVKSLKEQMDAETDTAAEKEGRERNPLFFLGNGDCYSHIDYYNAVDNAKVDTVMLARGALIKPWLFEEIEKGQYLDKTATERLDLMREYCRYGLECWGSDELGVATTRRFLMEWLSFTHRYVPIGILERLPAKIQDRPPAWKGRNEMETLLGSSDYRDWIKISEMFLGKAPDDFFFTPKHKSNAYDAGDMEAEG
ncbi:FMN-linked oxidoreductase [Ascodesmis nigricans]|uniref:tRNA-dihydrouridine(47) synthase [NAD(P)(+)] n=1 Tax=Ascodesmis nigricans TaxID=341454 RepID=A0A4S2N787_9PEZI|nr:FMN-linked oxidoreductase [Ascodesmis nigricans]